MNDTSILLVNSGFADSCALLDAVSSRVVTFQQRLDGLHSRRCVSGIGLEVASAEPQLFGWHNSFVDSSPPRIRSSRSIV
jgi:hypothetical protein